MSDLTKFTLKYTEVACRCAQPMEDETYCCLGEEFNSLCELNCGTCYDIDTDCVKGPCPDIPVIGCETILCAPGFQCVEDEDGNGSCIPQGGSLGCEVILCAVGTVCVEDTGNGQAGCVTPTCGGIEGCSRYSNGCDNCFCLGDGPQRCERINDCDIGDPEVFCPGCDPIPPPYTCDECAPGYFRDQKGQCSTTQSCGGIDRCTSLSLYFIFCFIYSTNGYEL